VYTQPFLQKNIQRWHIEKNNLFLFFHKTFILYSWCW
jgi:hypothetical protein